MTHYLTATHTCRSTLLLDYFGDRHTPPCGHCDVCVAEAQSASTPKAQAVRQTARAASTLDYLLNEHQINLSEGTPMYPTKHL
jgi:superfamily II DNA helicase RecQ